MRLSDLYKDPADSEQPPARQPLKTPPPTPPTPSQPPAANPTLSAGEDAQALNRLLHEQMRTIVALVQRHEQIPAEPILDMLKRLVASMECAQEQWIGLAHLATAEPYLVTHSINVAILSLAIAHGLHYTAPKRHGLAVKAYLHDLGMIQHADVVEQPRRLTPDEITRLQRHPEETAALIERLIPGVGRGVCYAILQEHERVSGTGYPHQLHDGEIEEDMRIIGLVDVYEALTHPRSWRERLTPSQAIQQLLNSSTKAHFDPSMLRLLVTEIGVYPVGTWVTLSTGESGRVLKTHPASPLRPLVEVLTNAQGEPLEAPRVVDLVHHTAFFIKEFAGYEQAG